MLPYRTHRHLIWTLAIRELKTRYQGSLLGRLWLLLTPLLMLAIYAFVFGEVLQAKWQMGHQGEGLASFALLLFSGLLVHQFFSECMIRGPDLVLGNRNFVKKILFPLEILPWVSCLVTGVQALFSLLILLLATTLANGRPHWEWIYLVPVYLVLLPVALGAGWLLGALGVFLRDLKQVTGFVATALLFLSPIFYPLSALPERMDFLPYINPLALVIDESRQVIFAAQAPDWSALGVYGVVALLFAGASLWFFRRCKRMFADVV